MWNQVEDDEALLARALEESLRHYNEVELPRSQASKSHDANLPNTGREDTKSFAQPSTSKQSNYAHQSSSGFNAFPQPSTSKQSNCPQPNTFKENVTKGDTPRKDYQVPEKPDLYDGEEAQGFDLEAGKTWLYPTNYPIRAYQRSIVETSLFHNTLVSLPTGLGKTFIAAVVMYNFYKWYPKGKVIFMAPTKPLVAQQVEHCYNTMGIPKAHTAEMTGALHSKERAALWRAKRVFFLTPQVVQNDLSSGICPAAAVKCVVLDEAHRATGDYAYCQVVKLLNSFGGKFRVLALSATPGSDLTAVQKVVSNLMISHIEIRNEDSPDLALYTHERNIEIITVSVGPCILDIREKYLRVMGEYCRKLQMSKVLFGNITSMSSFQILKAWNEFKQAPPPGMTVEVSRVLSADFALLHTLAHGLDLLQNYGLRLMLTNITDVMEDPTNSNGARLKRNDQLLELLEEVRTILDPPPDCTMAPTQPDFIYGHPKLDQLKSVIETHFKDFQARGVETRVIVFCEYREAVIEIRQLLTALEPLVKPVGFMGQSSGKHGKGISQKNQLLVMAKFREGVYNTLISTSVGEEGLDIGEVDLIICYDAKNSPIRQVQRMGRTGRKRKGRIIVLCTEGKEEIKFRSAIAKKKTINAMLVEKDSLKGYLLEETPSMLPKGFKTECVERKAEIAPASAALQQQDLRKMFSRKTTNSANNEPDIVWESPYVSDEELRKMLPGALEDISKAEDFFNNLDLARYLEWQRYSQPSFDVDSSTTSNIMVDLLKEALGKTENSCPEVGPQVSATQIWPGPKKRGNKRPKTSDGKEKVKRKRARTNTDKKPGRPASSSSSDSSDDDPVPSSFQSKATRVNPLFALPPRKEVSEDPEDPLPIDIPMDRPASPVEIADGSDDDSDNDSDPVIRAALKRLRVALRKEDDSVVEDDHCPVCPLLQPCEQLQKMMKEEQSGRKSWKKMEEMLNTCRSILPGLTEGSFAQLSPPESPIFVSMIPREDDFNDGIICGGVGDVSMSPLKESEMVKTHQDEDEDDSNDYLGDSPIYRSPVNESKTVKEVMKTNLPSDATLLDLDLDEIFAKIESHTNRNPQGNSPRVEETSPILGSQMVRSKRPSQKTPQPPRRSLFPIFQSQSRAESPEKIPEEDQRNISLDLDSFLEFAESQSPKEKAASASPQKSPPKSPPWTEAVESVSPVLKSQPRPKPTNKEFLHNGSSTPTRENGVAGPKTGVTGSEEVLREIEAFYEKSDDDIFAGLDDNQLDNVFNVSNAGKLDLDRGFKSFEVLDVSSSPKKKTSPVSPPKGHRTMDKSGAAAASEDNYAIGVSDVSNSSTKSKTPPRLNLSNLLWMDKSNASAVANVAPPQRKRLSLKKLSKPTSLNTTKQSAKPAQTSPVHVPDCFQPKKAVSSTDRKKSSEDDDFSRKVPDLPVSPIAKNDRPVTPNDALDELVSLLVSPGSSPKLNRSSTKSAGEVNRKRVPSSPVSPEMPRKKHVVLVESSPESPLFKAKKGVRRPLDDTVVETQRTNGLTKATSGWKVTDNEPESPLFAKPKKIIRALDETIAPSTSTSTGWTSHQAASESRKGRLSDSSDDEFVARNKRPKERREISKEHRKKPKEKRRKKKSAFVESEAEESDDERRDSSDGESTSLDGLDSSFIDDSPDATCVDVGDGGVDMHARYLQDTRSPAVKANAFKIPDRSAMPFRGNVYSQAVDTTEASCYMNDSFCVDDDEDGSDQEMSFLEVAEAALRAEKKERRKPKEKPKEKPQEAKKRSRIIRPQDSESDDDIQIIKTKIVSQQSSTKPPYEETELDANLSGLFDEDFDLPEIDDQVAEKSSTVTTTKPGSSTNQPSKLASTTSTWKPGNSTNQFSKPGSSTYQLSTKPGRWTSQSTWKPGNSSTHSTSKPGLLNNGNSTSKLGLSHNGNSIGLAAVQRMNTDDLNQLLDDDFDFSAFDTEVPNDFVAPKPKEAASATPINKPKALVIFVTARQAAMSCDIVRLLRVSYEIVLRCRATMAADYVLSRRTGVTRVAISDLKSSEKMEPIVRWLKEAFPRPYLIIENDKENKLLMATKKKNQPPPSKPQPEWTIGAITTLVKLRQAAVGLLFSESSEATAKLVFALAKREQEAGHGLQFIPEEFTDAMETKLRFLRNLPGINIALAVHLVEKFKTIGTFLSNCSTVQDIERNLEVKHQTAQNIYNVLNQVHMS